MTHCATKSGRNLYSWGPSPSESDTTRARKARQHCALALAIAMKSHTKSPRGCVQSNHRKGQVRRNPTLLRSLSLLPPHT